MTDNYHPDMPLLSVPLLSYWSTGSLFGVQRKTRRLWLSALLSAALFLMLFELILVFHQPKDSLHKAVASSSSGLFQETKRRVMVLKSLFFASNLRPSRPRVCTLRFIAYEPSPFESECTNYVAIDGGEVAENGPCFKLTGAQLDFDQITREISAARSSPLIEPPASTTLSSFQYDETCTNDNGVETRTVRQPIEPIVPSSDSEAGHCTSQALTSRDALLALARGHTRDASRRSVLVKFSYDRESQADPATTDAWITSSLDRSFDSIVVLTAIEPGSSDSDRALPHHLKLRPGTQHLRVSRPWEALQLLLSPEDLVVLHVGPVVGDRPDDFVSDLMAWPEHSRLIDELFMTTGLDLSAFGDSPPERALVMNMEGRCTALKELRRVGVRAHEWFPAALPTASNTAVVSISATVTVTVSAKTTLPKLNRKLLSA